METPQTQYSSKLLEQLSFVHINGDAHRLALASLAFQAIYQLGDHEHSSDWDPIITIKLTTGQTIESESHYADFEWGDLNDEEQGDALKHVDELTTIVVQLFELTPIKELSRLNKAGITTRASNYRDDRGALEAVIPIKRIDSIRYSES